MKRKSAWYDENKDMIMKKYIDIIRGNDDRFISNSIFIRTKCS